MNKFGMKSLAGASKFGSKTTHGIAKFGAKTVAPAATLAALANPEIAVPLGIGAMVAKPVLKSIQKATR